ncbi:hypothetical protein C2G38_2239667 [Gigaspora rosea]|uniref:histidine kinase n=1 Tax=Gigaspora rosea TaxID=44941 RepID=A0A397W097_9GLOM|nr:hypothetical protein C2G38_2239667 [Gigaspora rosea]
MTNNSVSNNENSNLLERFYNCDWSSTSLGPIDSWEPQIKSILDLCFKSGFPTYVYMGQDWITIYNEASLPVMKSKHPHAFLKPAIEIWGHEMPQLIPDLNRIRESGKGKYGHDLYIETFRDGYKEEMYGDYALNPIYKLDGTVWGVINITTESTQKILNKRRLKTLDKLSSHTADAESLESACQIIMKALYNNQDIPYALIYLIENYKDPKIGINSLVARLVTTTFDEVCKEELIHEKLKRRIPDYFPETHEIIDLTKISDQDYDTYMEVKCATSTYSFLICDCWPINLVMKGEKPIQVLLKDNSQAILLPTKLTFCNERNLSIVLICGINPLRKLDDKYMEFYKSVLNTVNRILIRGMSIEEEKKRAKILADLNHQKDIFFQGISHELKTPLTLIFSPLDELINISSQDMQMKSHLQLIQRNTNRLLKLINNLLQFSNIESGQLKARFYETDIAKFTRELAMNFENITRKLGLEYIIDVPNSDEFNQIENVKVYLDHEMYETIVFNLCSNAIKHTWDGSICVRLYLDHKNEQKMIVLEVSDTGVGIPKATLPNIFQRFYHVESQRSRCHEGAGIGLAIIKEFVKCHGGYITVTSVVNKGTTFKCWFPIGSKHLPINQICYNNKEIYLMSNDQKYLKRQLDLEENLQWIQNYSTSMQDNISKSDDSFSTDSTDNSSTIISKKYQILVVDDNIDMRNYLSDLLKEFDVICACDGQDAIQILNKLDKLPDLILSDIVMPNMNGYKLLDMIRSNIKTQLIPIILLTAKAGEESSIKGYYKGANNYLKKPFSSRELILRIYDNIKLSNLRNEILHQQHRQETIKQFLFTITEMIYSGHNLIETLSNIIKLIYNQLPCDRIFIISYGPSTLNISNSTLVALYENLENIIPIAKSFQDKETINLHSQSTYSQSLLDNNSGIEILLNTYCADTCKNVSMLSAEIRMNDGYWGCIKLHRPSNSIWLDSEIDFLQKISNQISLAIFYKTLIEENLKNEIQLKAETIANKNKTQILANISHELRTPLGAIIGLTSSFDHSFLTKDQKDIINIIQYTSDFVLSTVNKIFNTLKFETYQITSINTTFDLLDLFEKIIEQFTKNIENKQIELVLNYDIENLPRYIKSNSERLKQVLYYLLLNSIKFTKAGEIVVYVSIKSQKEIDDKKSNTNSQTVKKDYILIKLHDTGNGHQDSIGLGLSICKNLVTINGGKFEAKNQLGKGSKFWFTWNIEPLLLLNSPTNYILPSYIILKRILVIHPVESARNAILKYLKMVKKVDAFDTLSKGFQKIKNYLELYNQSIYDIVFIRIYEKNKDEIIKLLLELRKIEMHSNNFVIIFIVSSGDKGTILAKNLISNYGEQTAIIYSPITWQKITNLLSNLSDKIVKNNDISTLKSVANYEV